MRDEDSKFDRLSVSRTLAFQETMDQQVSRIPVSDIEIHESQPRSRIDETRLQELTDSIRASGMHQAIGVVRKAERKGYYIAYGQRRWLAHQRLGEQKILARIYDAGTDIGELSIIENYFNEDLSPIEEAMAFDRLAKDKGWNNSEMAKFLGVDRRTIGEIRAITNIDSTILEQAASNKDLTKTHLVEIARVKDPEAQRTFYESVVVGGVSTAEAREGRLSKSRVPLKTSDHDGTKIAKSLARLLRSLKKLDRLDLDGLKAIKKQSAAISREIKRLS